MAKTSSTLKANGYIYVSYPCSDHRLRYPSGVKDKNSLGKSDLKRIDRIKSLIDNYSIKYDLMGAPVLKAELQSYLDREINPAKAERKAKAQERDLVRDHKEMCEKMREGQLLKKRSKGRYSTATIEQYERMRDRWQECASDPGSGLILSYSINIDNFRAMVTWLTEKKYSQNSIYNIVNNLKIFLKYAHEEGYHTNIVYKHRDFNVPQEEAEAIAPTYEEVISIYNTNCKSSSDEKARDLFVFGCFIALRVSDLNRINQYKLVGDVFQVLTQKTWKKVTIPCHWIAKEIYEKYCGNLPTFLRQTFARKIARICKDSGLTGEKLITMTIGGKKIEEHYKRWELITPHSMRRFFATWMYRDLRRQPREIMAITGHDSEESFFKYIKIEGEMNAQEIASLPEFRKPT